MTRIGPILTATGWIGALFAAVSSVSLAQEQGDIKLSNLDMLLSLQSDALHRVAAVLEPAIVAVLDGWNYATGAGAVLKVWWPHALGVLLGFALSLFMLPMYRSGERLQLVPTLSILFAGIFVSLALSSSSPSTTQYGLRLLLMIAFGLFGVRIFAYSTTSAPRREPWDAIAVFEYGSTMIFPIAIPILALVLVAIDRVFT